MSAPLSLTKTYPRVMGAKEDKMKKLLSAVLFLAAFASNSATYQAEGDGVKVVVYGDDKCKLNQVTNLPWRATWTEKGNTTEGCAGMDQRVGLVVFYWNDKTVVVIPTSNFVRVQGA